MDLSRAAGVGFVGLGEAMRTQHHRLAVQKTIPEKKVKDFGIRAQQISVVQVIVKEGFPRK